MRIAVVTSSYPSTPDDPSGHFVASEVRALVRAGHRVTVFLPRCRHRRTEDAEVELCEFPHFGLFGWPGAVARVRERPWRIVGILPFVFFARRRLMHQEGFDQVVAHWLLPAFWPISCDYGARTTVVVHGSDLGLLERLPRCLTCHIVAKLSRADVVVQAVSTDLARRLSTLAASHSRTDLSIGIKPAKLEIPPLALPAPLRRELGLGAAPIVIVVGRVVKDKRIDIALDAILLALSECEIEPAGAILVVGDGPEREALARRYRSVRWLGQLGRLDTLRYIRAADLLVSASLHEGAPTVVREARALGTCVVAAETSDLAAAARDDPGLFVVPGFPALPDRAAVSAISVVLRRSIAYPAERL
jgi:teichuronic acid biosynthesis glycosyltransferase TuaC